MKPDSAALLSNFKSFRFFAKFLILALIWLGNCEAEAATYTLGANTLLEQAAAGIDSITLAVNPNSAAWTATTNSSWLHLAIGNQAGVGSTNVVFSFDSNPGITRTGSFTIAGTVLNIIQAGSTYVSAIGPLTSVVSNGLNFPNCVTVSSSGVVFIADYGDNAIKKWSPTNNTLSTVISSGLNQPVGVALDGVGNLYIADSGNNALKKWNVTNNLVTTLATGLSTPISVALDPAGNVYICNQSNSTISKWNAATSNVTTLVSSGLNSPAGIAVDIAGNVYIADQLDDEIKKWTAANSNLTTLVSYTSTLSDPTSVALDPSGNIYIADSGNYVIKKLLIASNLLETIAVTGTAPSTVSSVALDPSGNLFIADFASNTVRAIQVALVDPSAKVESTSAGTDMLSVVLPATQTFLPLFTPVSDQPWLTILGVTNAITTFAFTASTSNRTGHISLVGKSIMITQSNVFAVTPPLLIAPQFTGNSFQFSFSNIQGGLFSILSTTNLAVPLSNWSVVGIPTNNGSGLFQFALPATNADPVRFFRVRSN